MSCRSRQRRRRHGMTGLTLVEVLAAVVILGFAVTPMLTMMREGLGAGRRVEALSRSLMLAEATYEQLKARIQSVRPPHGYGHDYGQLATAFPAPDSDFKLIVTDDQVSGVRSLRITVWRDEDGSWTIDDDELAVNLDMRVADRS